MIETEHLLYKGIITVTETFLAIKHSVDLCNQRTILMDEIKIFNQKLDESYLSDDEFKTEYYRAHSKIGMVLIFSFAISFVIEYLLLKYFSFYIINPGALTIILTIFLLITDKYRYWLFHQSKVKEYAQFREQSIAAKDTYRQLMEEKKADLKKLLEIMEDDDECCIPQYYWNDANTLLWYIKNKRAYTLTDSINLLEHEKKQEQMLRYQQRQAEASEAAAYNAQIAAQNTEIAAQNAHDAAVSAGIGAMFSALNYFSKD